MTGRLGRVRPEGGALAGVKVLDLSRFIAGPFCAQILGDMGADVVKVERPGGEEARSQGRSWRGESLYTLAYNRNKSSATLDRGTRRRGTCSPASSAGRTCSSRTTGPGRSRRWGSAGSGSHELNPRLILTSLSGFGQTGPLAERALFDPIAQAVRG